MALMTDLMQAIEMAEVMQLTRVLLMAETMA